MNISIETLFKLLAIVISQDADLTSCEARLREANDEIEDLYNVDHALVIDIIQSTDLDVRWWRANIIERQNVIEGIREIVDRI